MLVTMYNAELSTPIEGWRKSSSIKEESWKLEQSFAATRG